MEMRFAWLLGSLVHCAVGEVFTSLVGLERLLEEESHLSLKLNQYIKVEEERLQKLQKVIQDRSGLRYLSTLGDDEDNPITAYRFIKNSIHFTAATIQLINSQVQMKEFVWSGMRTRPEEADLDGAAAALFRIQDTYNVSAGLIAAGHIPGAVNVSGLSADDAFHLGYSAAQSFDFHHALQWLTEADRRAAAEGDGPDRTFNASLLFDYIAYSAYEQGNPEWATFYGRRLKEIDPTYPAVENLKVYEEALLNRSSAWDGREESLPPLLNERDTKDAYLDYEALCRGEEKTTEAQRKELFCFLRRDSAFAFLAPFKAELLHRRPDLVLFYDVLSHAEVQELQNIAAPQLRRAMVVKEEEEADELEQPRLSGDSSVRPPDAEDEEGNIIASYRIAQNMWIEDEEAEIVGRISTRVEAMTGLTAEFAENLQIANYGIGGHYEPHYDMSTDEDATGVLNEANGNRIATVLFYFNEPESGGFTVFEELGLALRPKAKSAAFWMNVQRDGSPDMLTRHAACPVLYGVKWVANKWLHEFGQERARPCGLRRAVRYDQDFLSLYRPGS